MNFETCFQHSTSQLKILPQLSLPACAELQSQPEVKPKVLLQYVLSMYTALCMLLPFQIPRNMLQLFKAPMDISFLYFPFYAFTFNLVYFLPQILSIASGSHNVKTLAYECFCLFHPGKRLLTIMSPKSSQIRTRP